MKIRIRATRKEVSNIKWFAINIVILVVMFMVLSQCKVVSYSNGKLTKSDKVSVEIHNIIKGS